MRKQESIRKMERRGRTKVEEEGAEKKITGERGRRRVEEEGAEKKITGERGRRRGEEEEEEKVDRLGE